MVELWWNYGGLMVDLWTDEQELKSGEEVCIDVGNVAAAETSAGDVYHLAVRRVDGAAAGYEAGGLKGAGRDRERRPSEIHIRDTGMGRAGDTVARRGVAD